MNSEAAYSDKSDEELFELVKGDDDLAFRILYRRYDKRVFAYCLRALGNREAAEDVFQTVVMKVFDNRHAFVEGHFAGWLFTIARNESIKALKKKKTTSNLDDIAYLLSDDSDATGRDTILYDLLAQGIARLPEQFRKPLTMRYIEGYPYDNIAATMNCSVSLAKVRVFRAKKMLHKFLSPYMQELQ